MKKSPKRTEMTKKNIAQSFCILYSKMPLNKISVKSVIEYAGYNRSTFYEYFEDIYAVSENEGESVLLAKCGYGIAVLPGFLVSKDDRLVCIPIKDTKNIEYGLYYRNTDKHIKFFLNEYIKIFKEVNN